MKIMPIYNMKSKEEMALLKQRMDEHTENSIKGLPDNMILLVSEKAHPTITLKELKEKIADKRRTNNGVTTE